MITTTTKLWAKNKAILVGMKRTAINDITKDKVIATFLLNLVLKVLTNNLNKSKNIVNLDTNSLTVYNGPKNGCDNLIILSNIIPIT